MKALIIGATGATGKDLLGKLLHDATYTHVSIFVRRPTNITHPKLNEIITDFDNLSNVAQHINGDILFCCLGTTLQTAGSRKAQRHIDYDIPLNFAKLAREKGITRIVLVSAYGASANSWVFYARFKGKLEDEIEKLAFEQFISFRPGLLLRKNTDRTLEKLSAVSLRIFNALGVLRRFKPLPTSVLADKMISAPKVLPPGKHVISLEEIFAL